MGINEFVSDHWYFDCVSIVSIIEVYALFVDLFCMTMYYCYFFN